MRVITLPVAHAVYIILYLPALLRSFFVMWKMRGEDGVANTVEDFWSNFTDTIDTIVGCLD